MLKKNESFIRVYFWERSIIIWADENVFGTVPVFNANGLNQKIQFVIQPAKTFVYT